MARYIDADKIITDAIKERKFFIQSYDAFKQEFVVKTIYKDLAKFIDAQPTVDVVEVKHGEWKLSKIERGWNCCEYPAEYTCSVCGRTEKQQEPYCHCGAKMDGGKAE